MSAPAPTADLHWLDHLSNGPNTLELPLDGSRPVVAEVACGRVHLELDSALCAKIACLAKQAGGAPFSVILVAWQTLLARLSRQEEVLSGVWVMDRGPFPFRSGGKEEPGFLARVRRINGLINKSLPLPAPDLLELAAGLDHPTAPGVHPLFQAGIALHTAEPEPTTTTLDVLLQVVPSADGCTLILEHQSAIIHPETAARWLSHLRTLLEAASEEPDHSVFTLPLLTAAEREVLSLGLNAGVRDFPADECLHHWFERVVETTPDAPALTFQDTTLSYAELNRRANRIAHFLIAEGVRPDTLVGLCLERGAELVVALLGIMKSGGACLPVDLGCPAERVAFMLKDASAHLLLTSSALAERLPAAAVKTVSLDEAGLLDHRPDWNPATATAPEHLACVIYTSSADGRPKGSLLTHAGIVRLLLATDDWFQFGPTDVWTLFHSTAQDLSLWEIWGALLYGGRLVIVPWAATRSARDFYKLVSSEKVTVLNQTPEAFRELMAAEQNAPAPLPLDLRFVILGGNIPEMKSLKPWFDRHGDTQPRLVVMHGLTEATIHATYRPLCAADCDRAAVLGLPLPDFHLYVLDENGEPAPPGVPGELCLGGVGLARGYINRPELNEESFIPDPLSDRTGARLFKTGDLVRMLPDGGVELLGRTDRQMNAAGVRIEPGEIESVLSSHPAIASAAVLGRTTPDGEKRLIAWVVASTTAPTADALRAHLLKKLPDCMLPSTFVFVPDLPLTPGGQLDRAALPDPPPDRLETGHTAAAPATELESRLAAVWATVLGKAAVSVEDNFFELGGTSLLLTRIQHALRTDFGQDCSMGLLLQNPTVAGLAAALVQGTTETRRRTRPTAYQPTRLQLAALRAVKARAHAGLLRSTP